MCEEESDDAEAVDKLLSINDSIHRTIERYRLFQQGNYDAASRIPQGTLGMGTGVQRTSGNQFSLIDLDDAEPVTNGDATTNKSPQPASSGAPKSAANDLSLLDFEENPDPSTAGDIRLGPSSPNPVTTTAPANPSGLASNDLLGLSFSTQPPFSAQLPSIHNQQQQQQQQRFPPNFWESQSK